MFPKPISVEVPVIKWFRGDDCINKYEVDINSIVVERSLLKKDGYDAVICSCGYSLHFPKVKKIGVYKVNCPNCGHVANYHHLKNVDDVGSSGLAPVLCNAGSNAIHHHYFGCPTCGSEVGGFIVTGSGDDDWSTHEDKFCKECGQKIDWSNTEFSSIYKY